MRGSRSIRQAFPVTLYASLLLALLLLLRPDALRSLQSACAVLQCLPLRAVTALSAGDRTADGAQDAARARASRAVDALVARRGEEAARRPDGIDVELEPFVARVIERRAGTRDEASELILDLRPEQLVGVAGFATLGDALIGFVDERASAEPEHLGHARVLLLHHVERGRLPRRVPARVELPDDPLPIVVEPGSAVDAWPLRCVLPADPYRAAALEGVEAEVRTSGLADDPLGALPRGLRIGKLRVYGYRLPDGRVVPIGLFVEPAFAAETIHALVLWRPRGTAPPARGRPLDDGRRVAVRALRLPVPGAIGERLFVTTTVLGGEPLREHAALTAGERLIGVLGSAGLGYGAVARLGERGRQWPITLLPDDRGPLRDLVATAVGRQGGAAVFDVGAAELGDFGSGDAFSGPLGVDLPGGLWIGRARRLDERRVAIDDLDSSMTSAGGLTVHLHIRGDR